MTTIFVKRILALLLSLGLLLGVVGCGKQESLELRVDISGGVDNLDPQFATDTVSRTIIANCFEGLLRRDSQGKLVPGVAESYTLSPDRLRYTFTLRRDAQWSNGEPVTAADFVFALRRLFHSQVPSPYAEEFLGIRNAPAVLRGELPQTALGVRAVEDYTLEIELTEPSPLFVERLATTAAMPCNEEFFSSTRARYGLAAEYLAFDGVYKVTQWDNTKSIILKPNDRYHDATLTPCPAITLYVGRQPSSGSSAPDTSPAYELFMQGKSDLYLATAQELSGFDPEEIQYEEIKNKVWLLVFNTGYTTLENENIRRALTLALDSTGYAEKLPAMYGVAQALIPASVRPGELPLPQFQPFDPQGARAAMEAGLAELGRTHMAALTLLIPENMALGTFGGYLQKQWKDNLLLYGVNLETATEGSFRAKLAKRDFSLALLPLEASGEGCFDVLESFASVSQRNYGGFADPEYDSLLTAAMKAGSQQEGEELYRQAEQLLLDKAAVVPLFTQSGYYVFSKDTLGVELTGGLLDFRNAKRMQ